MLSYEEIDRRAFELSGMDPQTWAAEDEQTRLYWKLKASQDARKFVLVRMEQVGEPMFSKDGQSLVHVRLPWFRETDPSWAVSLKDIAGEEHPRCECGWCERQLDLC